MKIFAVIENYVAHDSDGWQDWDDNKILSYHSTQELAEAKIVKLINFRLEQLPQMILINPHIKDPKYWEDRKTEYIDNLIDSSVEFDGVVDKMKIYDYNCIELEN